MPNNFDLQSREQYQVPIAGADRFNFLQSEGDTEAPTVTRISPPADAELGANTPIVIEVRDNVEIRKSIVHARFPALALEEVVYRGNGFAPNYATFSSVELTEDEDTGDQVYTFTIRRTPGWPSSPTIDVIPIDTSGNEAT